jgi:hypothetical protein
VHPINEIRDEFGEQHQLMPQLRQDEGKFKEYLRMNPSTFDYLLNLIHDDLPLCFWGPTNPIWHDLDLVVG